MAGKIRAAALVVALGMASIGGVHAQTLSNLSDNEDCQTAETRGVVVSRQLVSRNREVEGFRFKDQYGVSDINVSLPEAMPKAKKAALHKRLLAILKPGARLKVGVQGCGAAARIEVLSSLTVLKG